MPLDPETIKRAKETKSLNLCGSRFSFHALELLVQILDESGECLIVNARGSFSLMEMGAYLAGLYTEGKEKAQSCQDGI